MSLCYFDSSSLVKRYISEPGSERVKELCDAEAVAISVLSVVEFASVLSRRTREGSLSPTQCDSLFQAFLKDTLEYDVLAVTETAVRRAAQLLLASGAENLIRSLDALHLATSEVAFGGLARGDLQGRLISSDRRLLAAAENPEDYA
jgi:predicted nucleic acid-binding protein